MFIELNGVTFNTAMWTRYWQRGEFIYVLKDEQSEQSNQPKPKYSFKIKCATEKTAKNMKNFIDQTLQTRKDHYHSPASKDKPMNLHAE